MTQAITSTRRDVLRGLSALGCATIAPPAGAATHGRQTVRGFVRVEGPDGARGLAGVRVTNGVEIVETDSRGAYAIAIEGDGIISIVKPTGYASPLEAGLNLPRFYYIHQPGGTPEDLELTGRGIDPTGALPASVDFTLAVSPEPDRFEAILFADPQPETNSEVDFIRDGVVRALAGVKAAFGLTLGDITGDDLSLYPRIASLIGQIGIPWRNAIGNHDLNYEAPNDRHARETFKRAFGPTYYAFEYGRALFIVLDNIVYHGADAGEPGKMGTYHDDLDARQLRFVENLLRDYPRDRLVVLGMHIPLPARRDESGREIATGYAAELLRIIGDRPCVSFAGHTHMAEHRYIWPTADARAPHHHQVLAAVCGSWWSGPFDESGLALADGCDGAPSGYYILSVDGARCSARFQPTSDARATQIRSVLAERRNDVASRVDETRLLGASLTARQASRAEFVVNIFDGGPNTRVECRVDGYPAIELRRDFRADPFVDTVYRRNVAAIKPWVKAEVSTHVWSAPLPVDMRPGVYRASISAIDEFGRAHRDNLIFEISRDGETLATRG